ncbi:MAG: hypothetical protein QME32_07545, partial [Endomicrobiia bacterium]|nr:hypothetical protein [Endomicrobiia bacterium]
APTTAEFLLINPSARSSGAGGASSFAGEADSLFLNPSLLAARRYDGKTKISAGYSAWTQNTNFGSFAGAFPFGERSAFGIGVLRLGAGGIEQRDVSGALVNGNLSVSNTAIVISCARAFGAKSPTAEEENHGSARSDLQSKFSLGASLKFISLDYASSSDGASVSAAALDLGAAGNISSDGKTMIAAVASNIGADINNQKLPLDFRLGIARSPSKSLTISAELEYPVHLDIKPKIGAEYSFYDETKRSFSLRLGMERIKGLSSGGGLSDVSFSVGGGFRMPVGRPSSDGETLIKENDIMAARPFDISIDYAFTTLGADLAPAHRISIGIDF